MPSNENSTFHNILELVFHEFVKHEGRLKVKLLTKMYNSVNMKYIYMWGSIDPICSNCIGKGWAQYPVSYVQTTLERAGPNTQFASPRIREYPRATSEGRNESYTLKRGKEYLCKM